MTDKQDRLSSLSPAKRRLLLQRLQGGNAHADGGAAQAPPLRRVPREGGLPLSLAQQRLWFLQQLEPGGGLYNIPKALRLKGDLNRGALERAMGEIIRRHEVLRTRFVVSGEDGQPLQVIEPPAPFSLPLFDLRDTPERGRDAELRRLLAEESGRDFDLSAETPLRVKLYRAAADEHVLLIVMHHIASDGWSVRVLARELSALYAAFSRGEESPLPELPVQYADYAVWQRERLSGETLERELSYWRKQLGDAPARLELPAPLTRRRTRVASCADFYFDVEGEVYEQLRELSRREGVTLFMTLLAALDVLLYRYTGREDLIVGTAIAGRSRAEVEGLIGFFVNTLALRVDLSGDPTVREVLGRVRESALGAYAHQEVPFEKLVEELRPERQKGRTPYVQVTLSLRNAAGQAWEFDGLETAEERVEVGGAKFDLTLALQEREQGLRGCFNYDPDVLDEATVGRMSAHFARLLREMAQNVEARVGELPLLSGRELQEVLFDWNRTREDFPRLHVHELFERQAGETPERVAVTFGARRLTYAELDEKAERLARRLSTLGVRPESCVGVCMERSLSMVVGLLAVLKAGGAYMPLDPENPRARLEQLVREGGARQVLVTSETAGLLSSAGVRLLVVGEDGEAVGTRGVEGDGEAGGAFGGDSARGAARVDDDNPAYVLFTSGSTGRPKGVVITHRAISNHMSWILSEFAFGPGDSVLQKTSFGFDASVWEFYAPLLSGGRLVVALPGGQRDAAYLTRCVRDEGVTVLQLVPSQLRMLLEDGGLAQCRSLRLVFCGGEALAQELVRQFYAQAPWARLVNLYGPTEATIDATWWECERGFEAEGDAAIGRPVANMRAYVLGRRMEPAGVGVAGELYLGGDGLARGYLGRPALTADRFVPDPHSGEPGARLYRTGDVARFLEGGRLEYLGRVDQQVKVRGFRIELGEVEAALRGEAGVREAAVVAREGAGGDKSLVAYVEAEPGQTLSAAGLRNSLKQTLPAHMVPAAFVVTDRLPLNASGKIDRKALAARDVKPEAGGEYTPPRNEVEEELCGIWQEVLRVERVGVHDDFFELGGHSLLALQIRARINKRLMTEISLKQFFALPTVAGLSEIIGGAESLERGEI